MIAREPLPVATGRWDWTARLTAHLAAALTRRWVVVTVRGPSMQPAYFDGDRVLVRRGRLPVVGEVAVVEQPVDPGPSATGPGPRAGWAAEPVAAAAGTAAMRERRWMIKRVAAGPGDPVPREPGSVLTGSADDRVPPGRLVLVGDNRGVSLDSRRLGYFPVERILGSVVRPRPAARPGSSGLERRVSCWWR
jgi:signal peptidase I